MKARAKRIDNQIKQQADALVERFMNHSKVDDRHSQEPFATHCAIIAVEEIIKSNPSSPSNTDYFEEVHSQARHHWHKVLEELKSRI